MASLSNNLLTISCFLLFINPFSIYGKTSFRPKQLVLPITKDPSTNQYLTTIHQRTPLVPVKLTLDLGGPCLWTNCEQGYVSSSYKHARCGSSVCKAPSSRVGCTQCFQPPNTPGCHTDSCGYIAYNPFTETAFVNGEIGQDVVSIQSSNGSKPGQTVSVPKFIFTCGSNSVIEGLANGVQGVAGLGRNRISLPSQFSSTFSFPNKFALCLSSDVDGFAFFGDGPYVMQPDIDISKSLMYTPLIRNPLNPGNKAHFGDDPSPEYYIGVRSIKIDGNTVPLNETLLKINKNGYGGTKISTVNPYTVMHSAIYNSFIKTFNKVLGPLPRVPAIAPFSNCYNSTFIGSTRDGPAIPPIDLVLQSSKVYWRIFGSNSMVDVKNDVVCLGFVDGGSLEQMASIIIGGHQLEDNLLQFDLATSKLGFSSSLLFRQTTCANFNYSSK